MKKLFHLATKLFIIMGQQQILLLMVRQNLLEYLLRYGISLIKTLTNLDPTSLLQYMMLSISETNSGLYIKLI